MFRDVVFGVVWCLGRVLARLGRLGSPKNDIKIPKGLKSLQKPGKMIKNGPNAVMSWIYIYGYHSPPLEPPYFIFLLLSEQASLQVIKRHFGRTSLVSRHIYLHLSAYVYASGLCPEAFCLKPLTFA